MMMIVFLNQNCNKHIASESFKLKLYTKAIYIHVVLFEIYISNIACMIIMINLYAYCFIHVTTIK